MKNPDDPIAIRLAARCLSQLRNPRALPAYKATSYIPRLRFVLGLLIGSVGGYVFLPLAELVKTLLWTLQSEYK
jgi:hypothetical protein